MNGYVMRAILLAISLLTEITCAAMTIAAAIL